MYCDTPIINNDIKEAILAIVFIVTSILSVYLYLKYTPPQMSAEYDKAALETEEKGW